MASRDDAWIAILEEVRRTRQRNYTNSNSNGQIIFNSRYLRRRVDESKRRTVRRVTKRLVDRGWLAYDKDRNLVFTEVGVDIFGLEEPSND